MYMGTYGDYPKALSELGSPAADNPVSSTSADLVDSTLAKGVKSGYQFTYTSSCKQPGMMSGYTIIATPLTPGVTGQRRFFVDNSGTIRGSTGDSVDANGPPTSQTSKSRQYDHA
jgi:hypothetical protein